MSTTLLHTAAAPATPVVGPTRKRWTREEYYRLSAQGWFHDQRVELIDGEIVVLPSQSHAHVVSLDLVAEQLRKCFQEGFWVRAQFPLTCSDVSEPIPDVSVAPGSREEFADHPKTAVLVVEVSKTSLEYDLKEKAHLFASIGVVDYWVLDLNNRVLHVHRDPITDDGQPFGHRYGRVETIIATGYVAPLEKPNVRIAIADLLPE